jgi:hypothetical protein
MQVQMDMTCYNLNFKDPNNLISHVVNANECLMTRLQEMSLDYHFKVEQEAGSTMFAFFGFNGNNQKLCK